MPKAKNRNPKSLWICEYCNKVWPSPSKLNEHRRVHTGDRPFPCNLCSYSTTTKGLLQIHIRRHLQEKLFKCPEPLCNYSTVTSTQLKKHQLVHTKKKRFSCSFPLCSSKFGQKANLTKHLKIHEEDPIKPFQCELCPFKTTSRCNLKTHVIFIHSTEKRFKCLQEGCNFAGKTKRQIGVNQHARIHQERTLSCPHRNSGCEYNTNQKASLKRHMKIHSGDKKYKCPLCEYGGRRATDLTHHMRTHTKEQPYKCQVQGCSFRAKVSCNLKKHVKRYH